MKIGFSRPIFEKYSNIKFHGNPSSARGIVRCGRRDRRTDRHDEVLRTRLKIDYVLFYFGPHCIGLIGHVRIILHSNED